MTLTNHPLLDFLPFDALDIGENQAGSPYPIPATETESIWNPNSAIHLIEIKWSQGRHRSKTLAFGIHPAVRSVDLADIEPAASHYADIGPHSPETDGFRPDVMELFRQALFFISFTIEY